MTSDIVSVEIGRSTWQGPAEEAPRRAARQDDTVTMTYRNYRGEVDQRTVEPIYIWFGSTKYHPEPGWLMHAKDLAKGERRDFALADCQFADLSPPPEREVRLATREELLAGEILAELSRARAKFPGKNVTFAALIEEVGELATATFEESADRVRKEALQVAVMAMRMILDGDHCYEPWRAEKGLDPLDPELRAQAEGRDDG